MIKYYSKHPLYSVYNDIKKRCENKNNKNYNDYGGRGITICKEWKENPRLFIEYCLENNWKKGLTIDRIDVNGNYCPENCRFVDWHIQAANQRLRKDNTSGYKGVCHLKINGKWNSVIHINKKRVYLGQYDTREEAVAVRNKYIKENNLKEYSIQS